jgi:glycosyltransferase involved in cell wall biosynthesis
MKEVIVVDSGSTDGTVAAAKKYGAKVVVHEFVNQAQQFNWALDSVPIVGDWILRLDADEYVLPELRDEIAEAIAAASPEMSGFEMKRRMYFWGRWIRHGGYYPTWLLRLFRAGKGYSELRAMDEHIVVTEGRVDRLEHDFVDENRKGLSFWVDKHNRYATREAEEVLSRILHPASHVERLEGQAGRKRKIKMSFYYRLPLFLRAFLYFIYRYIFRLGFLDGVKGLVFHFLQGFWYRFLVDAKIYEARYREHKRQ